MQNRNNRVYLKVDFAEILSQNCLHHVILGVAWSHLLEKIELSIGHFCVPCVLDLLFEQSLAAFLHQCRQIDHGSNGFAGEFTDSERKKLMKIIKINFSTPLPFPLPTL